MATSDSKTLLVDESLIQTALETDKSSGDALSSLSACGMKNYEKLGFVGKGSYGFVLKCRSKITGQLVAIKKFSDSKENRIVRKIAVREIKMLKLLQHDNLVNLIETFHRRKCLYLVFEFVDHTLLDELDKFPDGLDVNKSQQILWQVLKGTEFCHSHNIIHRDIKPENVLVSNNGVVKICDFGFARILAQPGEVYTDYVATRWYRPPELLVGDRKYGRAVDIWAVGCMLSEMFNGEPLFPGDSDIDQLYLVTNHLGVCSHERAERLGATTLSVRDLKMDRGYILQLLSNYLLDGDKILKFRCTLLTQSNTKAKEVFQRNPIFLGMRLPEVHETVQLLINCSRVSVESLDFIKRCLQLDPDKRSTCKDLLMHCWFQVNGFGTCFPLELKQKLLVQKAEATDNKQTCFRKDISKSSQECYVYSQIAELKK